MNQKTTYTDPRLAFAEEIKEEKSSFKQKFDGSSTAMHVLQGRDLTGKYAIVTGANSGIGNGHNNVLTVNNYFKLSKKCGK